MIAANPEQAPQWPTQLFGLLLVGLAASFFFVPEQHQRNWLLYLTALAAHGFLFNQQTWRGAFAQPGGWVVIALLAMPALSLIWSASASHDDAANLLLAAYCILLIYLGLVHLSRRAPKTIERLLPTLLICANLGALLAIGDWVMNYDSTRPRLPGVLGLDNPVHGSLLLLTATLPVWSGLARGEMRTSWLLACLAPCLFALLAGPRTALAAYTLMVVLILRQRFRPASLMAGVVLLGLTGLIALFASDALKSIWLERGLSHRPEIWRQSWSALLACNPLFGCGIATPLKAEYLPGIMTDRAHSLYVATLYHQGIMGVLTLLGALGWLLMRAYGTQQGRDWTLMLAYALLASLTSGDHILVRTTLFWCYFWLPLLVLAAGFHGAPLERNGKLSKSPCLSASRPGRR